MITNQEISKCAEYWRTAHSRDGGPLWAPDASEWPDDYKVPVAHMRGLLQAAGWGQEQAGEKCGVNRRTMSKYCSGFASEIDPARWIVLRDAAMRAVRAQDATLLHPTQGTPSFALAAAGFDPLRTAVSFGKPGDLPIVGWAQRGLVLDPRSEFLPVVTRTVTNDELKSQIEPHLGFQLADERNVLPGWAADGGLERYNLGRVAQLPDWLPTDLLAELEQAAKQAAAEVLASHHAVGGDWWFSPEDGVSDERQRELHQQSSQRRREIAYESGWRHTHDWMPDGIYGRRVPVQARPHEGGLGAFTIFGETPSARTDDLSGHTGWYDPTPLWGQPNTIVWKADT